MVSCFPSRIKEDAVKDVVHSRRTKISCWLVADSLMTIDTKSPDQSVAQQLKTTTAHSRIFIKYEVH